MFKRTLAITLCMMMSLYTFCSCSIQSTFSETDSYSSFDNIQEYKNITIKYPDILKQEEWEYADIYLCSEEPSFRISVKAHEESKYSYADDPAKQALQLYGSAMENAEALEMENIRVDDKPAYRQKFRFYDRSYMDYDEYVVFEYKSNIYIIDFEYYKKDSDNAQTLFDTFIKEIELK